MELIKWVQGVIVNDRKYQVEGFGVDMQDGTYQSVCHIETTKGDSTSTKRLTFQIFMVGQDLAAEIAMRCGVDTLQKRTYLYAMT